MKEIIQKHRLKKEKKDTYKGEIKKIREILKDVSENEKFKRLSAITAIIKEKKELIYHILLKEGSINFKFTISKKEIPSVIDIFPNANFYEKEAHDIFGIKFNREMNYDFIKKGVEPVVKE